MNAKTTATERRGYHSYSGRVAWVDTDASRRIHFTAPFRWAEAAEHDLLRSLGHNFHGGFPRVDVQATYRAPLRFGDEFEVILGVDHVGRTSIAYTWQIRANGNIAITGRHRVVHVLDADQATPLPNDLREQLIHLPPSSW